MPGGPALMSGEVVPFPRRRRREFRIEVARALRDAAEWMDRMGARGLASRYRREAARLEHEAAACGAPAAGSGA